MSDPNLALIALDGWKPPAMTAAAIADRSEVLAELNLLGDIKVKTPQAAKNAADSIGIARRWECDLEDTSKAIREPYFNHAKRIKQCSDSFAFPVIEARMKLERQLAEWEAEQIRIKQNLERQARMEADRKRREEEQAQREAEAKRQAEERAEYERLQAIERERLATANKAEQERLSKLAEEERQRQAEAQAKRKAEYEGEQARLAAAIQPAQVAFEPIKTDGVNSSAIFEGDVTDQIPFALWCLQNGRTDWIRDISFEKRSITAWLSKLPMDKPAPVVPGFEIRKVVSVAVKKAKKQPVRDVSATTRVALG